MKQVSPLAAALSVLMTLPASAQHPCLRVGFIWNWKAINNRTLIVEDNWHQKYRVALIGVCTNLQFHERLAFESVGGMNISCLEPGDEVISHDFASGPERCAVTHVEAYTPEMEQADRAAEAAKRENRDD